MAETHMTINDVFMKAVSYIKKESDGFSAPEVFFSMFSANRELLKDAKLFYATKDGKGFPKQPSNQFMGQAYVSHLFCENNGLFFNNYLVDKALSGQKSFINFNLEYSVALDTNVVSYIKHLVEYKSIDEPLRRTIYDIFVQGINYNDWPYIIENGMKLNQGAKIEEVYENLYYYEAFRRLSSIDDLYKIPRICNSKDSDILVTCDELFHDMEKMQKEARDYEKMKNLFFCLLSKMIWIKNTYRQKSISFKMNALLNFCQYELGGFLEQELIVAYFYFSNKLPFFFKNDQSKIYNKIRAIEGMAWDLTHLRILINSHSWTCDQGNDFIINSFLTVDKGLIELLHLFKIEMLFFSKPSATPITIFKDPLEKILETECDKSYQCLRSLYDPEKVEERHRLAKNIDLERLRNEMINKLASL